MYPPCLNPNCHSHGKPHPNCRCYSNMAEGGEAARFCDTNQAHEHGCEYATHREHFAEGGQAAFGDPEGADPAGLTAAPAPTPGMDALVAGAHGALKGSLGPLAAPFETRMLGQDPAEILKSEQEHPYAHMAGEAVGLLTGPFGKALRAVSAPIAAAASVPAMGVEGYLYSLADSAHKQMLGDPQNVVGVVTKAGLTSVLGAAGEQFAGKIASKLTPEAEEFAQSFTDTLKSETTAAKASRINTNNAGPWKNFPPKPGTPLLDAATPMSEEATAPVVEEVAKPLLGEKAARFISEKAQKWVASGLGALAGHLTGIPGAEFLGAAAARYGLKPFMEAVMPALIKPFTETAGAASGAGLQAAFEAMHTMLAADSLMTKAATSVFEAGSSSAFSEPDKDKLDKLSKHVEAMQANPEAMLTVGGDIGHYLPSHAAALAAGAQNAVNFLNNQRPTGNKPAPLSPVIPPTTQQELDYYRSLTIAEQPLMVTQFLKNGTLTPKDVANLHALYPAQAQAIIGKITDAMINHTAKGGQVPYKMRSGLSMLLNHPMDVSLSPSAMMASQATYMAMAQRQGQQAPKPKGSTSKIGKSVDLARTDSQARVESLRK